MQSCLLSWIVFAVPAEEMTTQMSDSWYWKPRRETIQHRLFIIHGKENVGSSWYFFPLKEIMTSHSIPAVKTAVAR